MKKLAILTIGIALTLILAPTIMAKGPENIPTNANNNKDITEEKNPTQIPQQAQNKAQKGKQNAPIQPTQPNENPEPNQEKQKPPGLQKKQNKRNSENANQGKQFGNYVSKLAKSQIPNAMNQLDINFGEIFVKPFTPATEQNPKTTTVENPKTSTQQWVVGPNDEYAAQSYKWEAEDDNWREKGNNYVVIWSKNELNNTENKTEYEFESDDDYPLNGTYTGYHFDITNSE